MTNALWPVKGALNFPWCWHAGRPILETCWLLQSGAGILVQSDRPSSLAMLQEVSNWLIVFKLTAAWTRTPRGIVHAGDCKICLTSEAPSSAQQLMGFGWKKKVAYGERKGQLPMRSLAKNLLFSPKVPNSLLKVQTMLVSQSSEGSTEAASKWHWLPVQSRGQDPLQLFVVISYS